jgi:hypothetical protein
VKSINNPDRQSPTNINIYSLRDPGGLTLYQLRAFLTALPDDIAGELVPKVKIGWRGEIRQISVEER